MNKRARGRPRGFSQEVVLEKALETFWQHGFEATSLDDLSAATGLNRPSLYAAFGDKESLYLAALNCWTQKMRSGLSAALDPRLPPKEALTAFYRTALSLYLSGPGPARGCMAVCTAPSTVAEHPAIGQALANILEELDLGLQRYLRQAPGLPKGFNVADYARLLASLLHSLAVRARAGQSEGELWSLVEATLSLVFPDPDRECHQP